MAATGSTHMLRSEGQAEIVSIGVWVRTGTVGCYVSGVADPLVAVLSSDRVKPSPLRRRVCRSVNFFESLHESYDNLRGACSLARVQDQFHERSTKVLTVGYVEPHC